MSTKFNTNINPNENPYYADSFELALAMRIIAFEGDGYFLGLKESNTVSVEERHLYCQIEGARYQMELVDDGIGGPTLINIENNERVSIRRGMPSYYSVMCQLLINPFEK